MAVSLAPELDPPERAKYLSVIDKFRELGVNESISLPQLVVVGDQSSGKSSLLEGLTGLYFPVASDLCTRFATQLVMRRAGKEDAATNITILPGPTSLADEKHKEHLQSFEKSFATDEITGNELGHILNEASVHMGLPPISTNDSAELASADAPDKRFADDVLKIELSGPAHAHLSIVDVPGLFHNPTPFQTEDDKIIIRNLIKAYIEDTRTVIMAVMDAKSNLANQEVFKLARDADPEGQRTVGIITKCDAVQEGDEANVMNIAENNVERLRHGWFAVRNRSTREIKDGVTIAQRHEKEKVFFSGAPWNQIKPERRGVGPLQKFLGQLLHEHIRTEFPSVVSDIESTYSRILAGLDNLGPARKTTIEQRRFLTAIAAKYQRHVDDSLQGNYDPELEPGHSLKLRKHLQDLGEGFAENVRKKGHTYIFRTAANVEDKEYRQPNKRIDLPTNADPNVLDNSSVDLSSSVYTRSKNSKKKKKGSESPFDIPDRGWDASNQYAQEPNSAPSVSPPPSPSKFVQDAEDGIYSWIRQTYRESRGAELPGTVNPAVLQNLFHQQSRYWESIANNYLKKVHNAISRYNEAVFKGLLAEGEVRKSLQLHLADSNKAAIAKSQLQLDGIVADERGTLNTLNHYYAENLEKLRKDRVMARLQKVGLGDGEVTQINMKELLSAASLSNEDQAVNDIHDILKSYYKVAFKRFVDNVPNSAVERELIRSQKGLLRYFTPEHVGAMGDDELAFVAAETYSTSTSRADNTQKAERFRQALDMAKKVNV
ncbi:MAG: hypothetical protein M1831_005640 [Alyxoria varia]|nr:MAG: hypothetical protein M1831_005640 [Alyxoria varia]